jgi:peroxiredoxin family protein
MSMEAMGISREELMDEVEVGGVADFLAAAEEAGTSMFI